MLISRIVGDANVTFRRILDALDGKLTLTENIQNQAIKIADTGAADSTITIAHGLGRIPVSYIWNIDRAGTVYDSNRASWTSKQITLKCSTAHSVLNLVLL